MTGLPYADEFPSSGISAWELVKVVFVLAIIVGLIILMLRLFAKRNRGWWMNRSLRSLGGYPLGTNKSMQIVEWNGRIYVLGVGENITLLESITDPELVASLLAEHDTQATQASAVLPEWLRRWSQRTGAGGTPAESENAEERPGFEQTLEKRLRQMAERRQRFEQLLDDQPEERSDKR